jgi:type IV secretory pathway VirB10-like protein
MPFEQRRDMAKPWFLIASLATILTFFAVACLLVRNATAPGSATPPAAGPLYQAADEHVPSDAAEAERTPPAPQQAEQTPRGPAAAPQQAEQTPRELAAPHQAELTPREPGAPYQNPDDPTADRISASEQIVFKSRRGLETVDPRELLRQGVIPPR